MLAATNLWAGPPFQTDDPEPMEFRHYEVYLFGGSDGTPVETDPVARRLKPTGALLPIFSCTSFVPFGAIVPSNNPMYFPAGVGPSAYGLTDIELGAKYRFIKETKHRPEFGTFTMLEIPTGSYAKGLGVGKVWYKLPIWAQKSWGHWTTYGGAGYQVVPQTGYRNFTYGGWLLQRDIGKKLTLGAEVYSHGAEGHCHCHRPCPATMIDIGGYYYIHNPGLQILFAYGHSAFGQTENYAYLGLYHTWGSEKGKGLNGFLAHHL